MQWMKFMKIVLADLDWKSPFPVCLYQLMNASCAAGALLASQPNMSSVQSYSQGKVTAKGVHQAVPNCMGVECAQIILDPFFLVLQVAEQQVAAAGALRGWGRHSCSSCRIKVSIYKKEWHKPLWFLPQHQDCDLCSNAVYWGLFSSGTLHQDVVVSPH